MTIITQGDSSGRTRRCDGTCHRARGRKCTCICGGRYHGAGDRAQELLTEDWLGERWREVQAAVEAAGGRFDAVVCDAIGRLGGAADGRRAQQRARTGSNQE